MTNKQLKKKIEETLGKWITAVHPLLVEDLMKRSKEYTLSVLPKEEIVAKMEAVGTAGKIKSTGFSEGFNQCRNQTKEAIEGK